MGHGARGLLHRRFGLDYLPHDGHAPAYRWGEDGIGGLCDENQYLGSDSRSIDPILKGASSVSPTGRAPTARTSRNWWYR